MNKMKIAQILVAASAFTGGVTLSQAGVQATELKTDDNAKYVDNIENSRSFQRGQVINAPSNLRVRSDAGTNSSIIGYLVNGSTVDIKAEKGEWLRINFNGRDGYVHKDYVKVLGSSNSSNQSSEKGQVVNITTILNIRQSASTSSAVLGTLKNGATFDIVGKSGSWYNIKTGSIVGYVHSDYVKVVNTETPSQPESPGNNNSNQRGKVVNITSKLNIRQYSSTSSAVIGSLRNGETFDIIAQNGEWYNIKTGSTIGFIHGDYVQVINSNTSTPETPSTPDSGVSSEKGKVVNITSNLRVRTAPNTRSDTLGYLLNGNEVDIIGESGAWYKINYKGKTGYVHKDYIQKIGGGVTNPPEITPETPSKPDVSENKVGQVINISSNLRVRSAASTDSSILGYLLNGQRVNITGETGNWYQISFNGTTGYVSSEFVKIIDVSTDSNPSATFDQVLNVMKAHIGSPYVWGGGGEYLTSSLLNTLKNRYPSETGRGMYTRAERYVDQGYRAFDCSGLMQWGFNQVGISLGRSTWDQIGNGREVSVNDAKPGDLLFYSNLQHVGMYIGNGQWIEAPNQNADVRIVDVPWSKIGRARRVIE